MKQDEVAFLAQMSLGWFHVETDGTVWRTARFVAGSRFGTPPVLKYFKKPIRAEKSVSAGYLKIMFSHMGQRMTVFAHRIVWMVMNGDMIPDGLQINHMDGKRANNHPENLELVTPQQNSLHAARVLKTMGKRKQTGEHNSSAKLTASQVSEIRGLWAEKKMSQPKMAHLFGVAQGTISNIILRKTWKHIP